MDEIRDPREKFSSIQKVSAAAGIKIAAPNLEDAVAGGPVLVVNTPQEQEEAIATIKSEIQSIRIDTDSSGIILKADTLGSLEALIDFLKEEKVQIRKADVGSISKRDITEATIVKETDPLSAVILAFHTKILPDAKEEAFNQEILIFENDVIYRLIEEYLDWVKEKEDEFKTIEYDKVKHPSKILFLPQYIFRRSDPAVIGIRVLGGTIRPKTQLINKNGKIIGVIRQIQDKSETIARATKNQEVAISIAGGVVGRNIKETKDEFFYINIPEKDFKLIKQKFKKELTLDDKEILEEFVKIKRKDKKFWGL